MSRATWAALALLVLAGCERPALYEMVTPPERLKGSHTPWIARGDAERCFREAEWKAPGGVRIVTAGGEAPRGEWPDDVDVRRFFRYDRDKMQYFPMVYDTPVSSFRAETYAGTTLFDGDVNSIPTVVAVGYVKCMGTLGYVIQRMEFPNTPVGWTRRWMVRSQGR